MWTCNKGITHYYPRPFVVLDNWRHHIHREVGVKGGVENRKYGWKSVRAISSPQVTAATSHRYAVSQLKIEDLVSKQLTHRRSGLKDRKYSWWQGWGTILTIWRISKSICIEWRDSSIPTKIPSFLSSQKPGILYTSPFRQETVELSLGFVHPKRRHLQFLMLFVQL